MKGRRWEKYPICSNYFAGREGGNRRKWASKALFFSVGFLSALPAMIISQSQNPSKVTFLSEVTDFGANLKA
jgi:hypothetical protein